MADKVTDETAKAKSSLALSLKKWGDSALPPALLSTFIGAQHLRPPQYLPLAFAPILMFSSYLNVNSYVKDSAGITAAWSGLYLLLAARRKQTFRNKWSPRGALRGATLALCAANVAGGGVSYVFGKRDNEGSSTS
ncbi:hypothetical protein L228DRAFT_280972 [Xylona heveae TC161]|uniref:Altered inheritance of mitochondria protein 19 n=1 Tax=Xylona heveae (strain CBS 132557 / TC161) TaxID=1328760 RepID=A0A165J5H7_XYLHT|nr:hypothetical protein L228DRAFT_280972 [Xylona heveae TC161]KZF25756.1 hypothetical protein L228DRAFT_280972 [Xylona heveae TC161]